MKKIIAAAEIFVNYSFLAIYSLYVLLLIIWVNEHAYVTEYCSVDDDDDDDGDDDKDDNDDDDNDDDDDAARDVWDYKYAWH